MLKIANVKILYKVLVCFVLLGAVVGGAVWTSASSMQQKDTAYSDIIDNQVAALTAGQRAQKTYLDFVGLIWRQIAENNPEVMKWLDGQIKAARDNFNEQLDSAIGHAPKFADRYEKVKSSGGQLYQDYLPIETATKANNAKEAISLAHAWVKKAAILQADIKAINSELNKTMRAMNNKQTARTSSTILFTTASISGALIVVLLLAFSLVQFGIARPIAEMVEVLNKLAAGNFNVKLPWVGRKDEIGQIAEAVHHVVDKVGATVIGIKTAANEVTNATAEISTSTTDLSQRTEEQAASLEETSASMEEISSTVKKNADSARQANEFATETNAVAERGGTVVGEAVSAMARIEESSRKISDIIGVIDEIARQTNLLALNAAVEAARAGEAGRGFAVVASEVRTLAQRSSQAAKDIKDLITSSNTQVKDGVTLVNKAGESLNEIVASIKKVAEIVNEIANASIEQSTGVEQINKALAQMDEVTQQNSALVEENAATAKTLEEQARAMDAQVAFFQVGGSTERPAATQGKAASEGRNLRTNASVAVSHAAHPAARTAEPARIHQLSALKQRAAGSLKHAAADHGGPVGHMQGALAVAINEERDWKEF